MNVQFVKASPSHPSRLRKLTSGLKEHSGHTIANLLKVSLPGFVASSTSLLQEESELLKVCTSDAFDSNL